MEGGAALVQDASAARKDSEEAGYGDAVGDGHVAGEGHVAEVQRGAAFVQDAGPAALDVALDKAMRDRQTGNRHGGPTADVEDPAGSIAADAQFLRAQALDVQVLGDRQL